MKNADLNIKDSNYFKTQFLLDPEIIFLNHGSFGATPATVFDQYQKWQRALEFQPVKFSARDLPNHIIAARTTVADYFGVGINDLVFVPNATFAVNQIVQRLELNPGDKILTTNHEYGACNNLWQIISEAKGAIYKQCEIPTPITSKQAILARLENAISKKTRYLYISHITSPTAIIFPIKEICALARAHGIITIIDGAHAPGQIPVNLAELEADIYFANLHKWICSPKGAGFLYIKPELQDRFLPLVIGWGLGKQKIDFEQSPFANGLHCLGTKDYSAYLSSPAAIQYLSEHNWPAVRARCKQDLRSTAQQITALTKLEPLYDLDSDFYSQMISLPIPKQVDLKKYQAKLYSDYKIEVLLQEWNGQHFIRISAQAYNSVSDFNCLVQALKETLT